jgi:RNA polymerase sigma factor (sigma-70 family)
MNRVLRHLRRAALLSAGDGLTDAQLLETFLARREEAAFEVLLKRHGPMVLGVCRRVLGNPHDADDAFQATFLVLARKAASVRSREALGSWLYGVAYRTATKARAMNAKRRTREKLARERPPTESPGDGVPEELLSRLDAELNRLPDKYRVPVVLCDLEGKTRKEAARLLGLPEGTLSWRLAQAKKLLAQRLSQHGTALPACALAALLSQKISSAALSPALVSATTKAGIVVAAGQALTAGAVSATVLALTEGVMKAMLLTKLKVAAGVVLLAVCVGTGAAYRATARELTQGPDGPQVARSVENELEALRLEIEALRKGLQATRERVKVLETQVEALRPKGGSGSAMRPRDGAMQGGGPPMEVPGMPGGRMPGPAPGMPRGQPLPHQPLPQLPGMGQAQGPPQRMPTREQRDASGQPVNNPYQVLGKAKGDFSPQAPPPGGTDLLAEAEAAIKKLRQDPNDNQATESLEKAVKRLKEQGKSTKK